MGTILRTQQYSFFNSCSFMKSKKILFLLHNLICGLIIYIPLILGLPHYKSYDLPSTKNIHRTFSYSECFLC
jgi:hypothetical protein